MKNLSIPSKKSLLKICVLLALLSGAEVARSNSFRNLVRRVAKKERIVEVIFFGAGLKPAQIAAAIGSLTLDYINFDFKVV